MISVLLLGGAAIFSYFFNKILLKFSSSFGVSSRQEQNVIRWASTSKPTTGGFSFYVTFVVGSVVLLALFSGGKAFTQAYLALFLSATLAFLVGFADDAYGTHPWWKLAGQVASAVVLIAFGVHIEFFSLYSPDLLVADYLLTIFWVTGIMNSLNMLDNMDGVTTTVALSIALITLPMIYLQEGVSLMYQVFVLIAGGFLGFLFWNWRPAKIYMGDTGSMFIGMVLAFAGIQYFWNIRTSPDNISHLRIGLIPLLAFLATILDTTLVTIGRIRRGISPFHGGKDHLTHNLVRVGVTEDMVPVLFGVLSFGSGILAVVMYYLISEWTLVYTLLFALYPIGLFIVFGKLFFRGMKRMEQQAKEAEPQPVSTEEAPKIIDPQ